MVAAVVSSWPALQQSKQGDHEPATAATDPLPRRPGHQRTPIQMRPGGLRGHRQIVRDRRPGTVRRAVVFRSLLLVIAESRSGRCWSVHVGIGERRGDSWFRPSCPWHILSSEGIPQAAQRQCRSWRRRRFKRKSVQFGSRGGSRSSVRYDYVVCIVCSSLYVVGRTVSECVERSQWYEPAQR